jgi:cation diffusion facilitator family transporter
MSGAGVSGRDEVEDDIRKARRLAWLSIAYLCSSTGLLILVSSGSQALKTEWVADALSLIPPILFLVGNRVSRRPADPVYPFGYERAVSAGYLGSAVVLLGVGAFLFFDSAMKLVLLEHPSIGGMSIFGHAVWTGWLGLLVLVYCLVPVWFLGRAKRKLGERLHDKTLLADGQVNEADWQSTLAAMLGIIGLALGFWWADALAALFISFEIIRDGVRELRTAIGDVMDRRPQRLSDRKPDPLPERLNAFLLDQDWVRDAVVRVRERGREFTAEAHVVPSAEDRLIDRIETAEREAKDMDRRLRKLIITPARRLDEELEAVRPERS